MNVKTVSLRFLTGPYVGAVIHSTVPVSIPLGKCIRDPGSNALLYVQSSSLKGSK